MSGRSSDLIIYTPTWHVFEKKKKKQKTKTKQNKTHRQTISVYIVILTFNEYWEFEQGKQQAGDKPRKTNCIISCMDFRLKRGTFHVRVLRGKSFYPPPPPKKKKRKKRKKKIFTPMTRSTLCA